LKANRPKSRAVPGVWRFFRLSFKGINRGILQNQLTLTRMAPTLSVVCRVLNVTQSGFHAWRNREPSTRDIEVDRVRADIHKVFDAHRGRNGAPRSTAIPAARITTRRCCVRWAFACLKRALFFDLPTRFVFPLLLDEIARAACSTRIVITQMTSNEKSLAQNW
jgi:hypothetical protein